MTEFRSSRFCSYGNCVEVGFHKSSFSVATATCVEVAIADEVLVRDSKDRDGPVLSFSSQEWGAFIEGCKHGEFDLS